MARNRAITLYGNNEYAKLDFWVILYHEGHAPLYPLDGGDCGDF